MSSEADTSSSGKLGAGIIVGIVFIPIIFAWFTLKKGVSTTARIVSFLWMLVFLGAAVSTPDDTSSGASSSKSVKSSVTVPSGHLDPNDNFGDPSGFWGDMEQSDHPGNKCSNASRTTPGTCAPAFRVKGWSTEMNYQEFVDYAISQGGRLVQSVAPPSKACIKEKKKFYSFIAQPDAYARIEEFTKIKGRIATLCGADLMDDFFTTGNQRGYQKWIHRKNVLVAFDQDQTIAGLPLKYARFEYNEQNDKENKIRRDFMMQREIKLILAGTVDDLKALVNLLDKKFPAGQLREGYWYLADYSLKPNDIRRSEHPELSLMWSAEVACTDGGEDCKFLSINLEEAQSYTAVPEIKVESGDL